MFKKISDYGVIGNLHSIALVGSDGSIDWLCLPNINSPSIFGALLDDKKGGRFSVSPSGEWDSTAEYIHDTNILVTNFRTRSGEMKITDFMPIPMSDEEEPEVMEQELYRHIEAVKGTVSVKLLFEPRFDYARASTSLQKESGGIIAKGDGRNIALFSTQPINMGYDSAKASWKLNEGDKVWLRLVYGLQKPGGIDVEKARKALSDTKAYWEKWLKKSETGKYVDLGPYGDMVNRSALVLKLLYYSPKGTIAAAATTSLPEEIGGARNWDYRYTWLRDTSFTLQALLNLGHISETEGYIRWIENLLEKHGAQNLQVMYGLDGERDLREETLSNLGGYKDSRPVRIGNDAATQKQLDIYGELMDAALKLSDYVGKVDSKLWPSLSGICDYVIDNWTEKDSGIWEVRSGQQHFVYSKVMCWVALDRGIRIARRYGFPADLKRWEESRDKIMDDVLKKGWNKKKQAFVQHYNTDALDASSLLIPILGFLPFDDPRVMSTVEAVQRELSHSGLLYRYTTEDGLTGREGTFLLCTFWLIDNLIAQKRFDEAQFLLDHAEGAANHLGLFSEEYDFKWHEALGNFPQAFTHIGYINSVIALCRARKHKAEDAFEETKKTSFLSTLLSSSIVLNEGDPKRGIPAKELASRLKSSINVLRGGFFDMEKGRVAYELMHGSEAYKEYVELTSSLKNMNLDSLKSRDERLAFWINLYNVIVIHGVIALGIKDSVKEVRNFFKRISYQIDDMFFSPDDIEHGILRGNSAPPASLFKQFKATDKRLRHIVAPPDYRIHFALVCGSSSCPPIEVYTADNIDEELTIAGNAFLNGGGISVDVKRKVVSLSRIFKWYGADFADEEPEILKTVAPYLYDDNAKKFIEENADDIAVEYKDYDWRLNMY